MEYKIKSSAAAGIILEKYMESKGFFRNATGSSKVGMIRLDDYTNDRKIEEFLTKEDEIYYMNLGCADNVWFIGSYRGEASQMSIGDKKHNISIEERIKFLYEALSANANYNSLGIIYKDPELGVQMSLFEINKWPFRFDDDIDTFYIKDL